MLRRYHVYQNPELILSAYTVNTNGIGRAYARPEIWAEGLRFPAYELSLSVRPDTAFVQAGDGYFEIAAMEAIGLGRMGRLIDGRSIKNPIPLSPGELIVRGGARLAGPWKRMELEGFLPIEQDAFSASAVPCEMGG